MTTPATATRLRLVANTIRGLAMDAVQAANSGHPGMPMGAADLATWLWLHELRYSPAHPDWPGRDRFVLSAGHGSALLYSLLHLAGFGVTKRDLQAFRQLHSKTPGHPEYGLTPGVETTTGPLGQGFANGVGLALGAAMAAERFANPLLAFRVVGIVSDGDLMEGISAEAASLAGHLRLGNLVYFYDDNQITIDGATDLCFSEQVERRFDASGWHVLRADGHDFEQLAAVAAEAFAADDPRPKLVICRTHIGYGSPHKQDTSQAHGAPLGQEEVTATKAALGLPAATFHVPDEVYEAFREATARNDAARERWEAELETWLAADPARGEEYRRFAARECPADLFDRLAASIHDAAGATRSLSGKALQAAAAAVPSLVGGSADLASSCKTTLHGLGDVSGTDHGGRNLHFGIREHAMGAILNGLALHGAYLPMGSTFLVFSDYMRPAIRLAALMQLQVAFVFTHDSLMVGEDGPTHQPVEHVAALRLIPNLHVYRPAGWREVAAAWTHALTRRTGPVALVLTRQDLPAVPCSASPADVQRGGYVVSEPARPAVATVVATGSELALVAEAAERLADTHPLRVVSMPCLELFLAQDRAWRERCLPSAVPVFAVEMGRPEPWVQLTGDLDRVIGLQRFGASAPATDLAEHFGFTSDAIAEQLRQMVDALA